MYCRVVWARNDEHTVKMTHTYGDAPSTSVVMGRSLIHSLCPASMPQWGRHVPPPHLSRVKIRGFNDNFHSFDVIEEEGRSVTKQWLRLKCSKISVNETEFVERRARDNSAGTHLSFIPTTHARSSVSSLFSDHVPLSLCETLFVRRPLLRQLRRKSLCVRHILRQYVQVDGHLALLRDIYLMQDLQVFILIIIIIIIIAHHNTPVTVI